MRTPGTSALAHLALHITGVLGESLVSEVEAISLVVDGKSFSSPWVRDLRWRGNHQSALFVKVLSLQERLAYAQSVYSPAKIHRERDQYSHAASICSRRTHECRVGQWDEIAAGAQPSFVEINRLPLHNHCGEHAWQMSIARIIEINLDHCGRDPSMWG